MTDSTTIRTSKNYSEILRAHGLSWKEVGYYYQVGELEATQGWVLHLSVVTRQLTALLAIVIPEMIKGSTVFKIVQDEHTCNSIQSGTLGYKNLGKIVCIYPADTDTAIKLVKRLIDLTKNFNGPAIPTDRHLGSILYTGYGSFGNRVLLDTDGQPKEFIHDLSGKLVPDPHTIPFTLPKGISWPFAAIVATYPPAKRKMLNYAYYPLKVIKADAKGDVMIGIYFKKWWQIRHCIIKQGRHDMYADDAGRDIQSRLQWQYELYQALHKDIPMPEVFDCFEEHGDTYLAMQLIDGISITSLIETVYKDRCWRHISPGSRRKLLDRLLEIGAIIHRMHEKGFVHRDITPDNFLLDKKGQIFLIDMELGWNLRTRKPSPSFRLGTPGHMSPEQEATAEPTAKEDIYGFGGLMIVFFTGLPAMKLNAQPIEKIREAMVFFTGSPFLAEITAACFHENPSDRPDLGQLLESLKEQRVKLEEEDLPLFSADFLQDASIKKAIMGGIGGLGHKDLLANKTLWVSGVQLHETRIGNMQQQISIFRDWHTGISGPLWLVARAKMAGYSIDDCQSVYTSNWEFLRSQQAQDPAKEAVGLFTGSAGIAMAIVEGLNSGLLTPEPAFIDQLANCFQRLANTLELSGGVAGQGIALLNAAAWLDKKFVKDNLERYLRVLLQHQQPDGSWDLSTGPGKKADIFTGLDRGVAGIAWFLLHYQEAYPNPLAESALQRSLSWLEKKAGKLEYGYLWTVSTASRAFDPWSAGNGFAGIALVFIHAFRLTKNTLYKELAVGSLQTIPFCPVREDLSLGNGLAGLGEVYLEAYRVFRDALWLDRVAWVANLLITCSRKLGKNAICWQTNNSFTYTADLFSGNSGVIHFLMRYRNNRLNHPLTPNVFHKLQKLKP